MTRQLVENSNHAQMPGAVVAGPVGGAEMCTATLVLRRRIDGPPLPSLEALGSQPPGRRRQLSHGEFAASYGADPADIARVRHFAASVGLKAQAEDVARRIVIVVGSAALFAEVFAVRFVRFSWRGHWYRAYLGHLSLPEQLHPQVTAVLGLDERPVPFPALARHPGLPPWAYLLAQGAANAAAMKHLQDRLMPVERRLKAAIARDPRVRDLTRSWGAALERHAREPAGAGPAATSELLSKLMQAQDRIRDITRGLGSDVAEAVTESQRAAFLAGLNVLGIRTPPQVASLYGFPPDADGSGQCIAIIELGGGFRPELQPSYFDVIGVPTPSVSAVRVEGGQNLPGVVEIYDSEVCLDIDVAGGAAPGARLVCYFASLSAAGMIEAIRAAVHDETNNPSVVTLSWSMSEAFWLQAPMYIDAMEEVLQDAAMLGVTVCIAAGDYGAASEFHDGAAWVNYPASSPYALSCGGTTLFATGDRILYESAWNILYPYGQATGGGISQVFPPPAWQAAAQLPPSINPGQRLGRGVPDVSANADPFTGYLVQVNGNYTVICGTSAVAPLWAALIARLNQRLGVRIGYFTPFLYTEAAEAFRDVVLGGNGGYLARVGWDPCTGWGSPHGARLRSALAAE